MLPDRVSNPRPLTYESGALPIALRGPATPNKSGLLGVNNSDSSQCQSVFCKILKIWSFMDRFFRFLSRNKSVFSLKNRSRTSKTDDFSSPGLAPKNGCKPIHISCQAMFVPVSLNFNIT